MSKSSYHILRVGTAITFLWIGVLILKEPEAWGSYILPWVEKYLPMSIKDTMITTAILDLILGGLLLVGSYVWIAGFVGAFHMIVVIAVSGINEATVRDIAILGGTLALFAEDLPESIRNRFIKKSTTLVQ